MNVTCPNCATIYRVDPAKVPEAGVRARCAVCSAIFPVRREEAGAPAPQPVTAAAPPEAAPPPPSPAPPPAPRPDAAAPPAPEVSLPAPTPAPALVPPRSAVPALEAAAARAVEPMRPTGAPAEPARAGRSLPPRPATPPAAHAAPASGRPAPAMPPRPAAPAAAPRRPVNPFLSQDPSQKARRLARALISDMVVYHPAKRREGIRDGTLKQLFEEEIKKSWEEYSEQVGRDVAESSNHFKDALNEILADGRQIF